MSAMLHRLAAAGVAVMAASLLLTGCGTDSPEPAPAQPEPLLLSGPTTHVMVTIPPGWH